MVIISPVVPHETAVEAADQSRLSAAISSYVSAAGIPLLAEAPPSAICDSASAASNSTVMFDVLIDGEGCPSFSPPLSPLASSSLALGLPGRYLVVEAWLARA